jgi:hypothetical protein
MNTRRYEPVLPKRVLSRNGKIIGVPTGASYPCSLEGCTGRRIVVRWPDGRITRPCTKGLASVDDKGTEQLQ